VIDLFASFEDEFVDPVAIAYGFVAFVVDWVDIATVARVVIEFVLIVASVESEFVVEIDFVAGAYAFVVGIKADY